MKASALPPGINPVNKYYMYKFLGCAVVSTECDKMASMS